MTQTAEVQTQMVARELLNPLIPPLKNTDTVEKALGWMSEFHLRQLPVVMEKRYCGLVSEDELYDVEVPEALVGNIPVSYEKVFVNQDAHFYEIMQLAGAHDMELMPVLDEQQQFEGVVSIKDSVMTFARLLTLQNPGGVIILLMESRDYSLSEISRLVEENGAKIMSVYTEPDMANPMLMRVTLKLNRNETNPIVATLERFDYRVVGRYEHQTQEDWTKERIDSLFKFLEW